MTELKLSRSSEHILFLLISVKTGSSPTSIPQLPFPLESVVMRFKALIVHVFLTRHTNPQIDRSFFLVGFRNPGTRFGAYEEDTIVVFILS